MEQQSQDTAKQWKPSAFQNDGANMSRGKKKQRIFFPLGVLCISLIFISTFFCGSVQAQNNTFLNAVIVQHDGTQINCFAQFPSMSDSKTIRYKIDNSRRTQKIKSKDIKTVRYYLRNGDTVEIEYLRYMSFIEMSHNKQSVFAPEWLEVMVRGQLMLYVIQEVSSRSNIQRRSVTYHYYVKRENEDVATEIAYVRHRSGFLIYRMEAENYFANAPDIQEKIDRRVDGYTAKDIISIVEEYNTVRQTIP